MGDFYLESHTGVQIQSCYSDEENEVSEVIFAASRALVKFAFRYGVVLQTQKFGFWTDLGRPCDFATARPESGEPAKFSEDSETFSSSRRLLAGRPFMDLLPESSKIPRPPPDLLDLLDFLLDFLDFS